MPAPQEHQDAVYDYLQDAALRSRNTDTAPFTREAIAKATGLTESEVGQAISDCKEDISTHLVQVKVHLPITRSGDKVHTRFAKSRMVARSPWAAAFLAMLILYIGASNYPPTRITAPDLTSAEIYLDGIGHGIVIAGIAGLLLAFLFQQVGSKWTHWQAKEPTKHDRVRALTKASLVAGAALVVGYFAISQWNDTPFDWPVASGLFLGGFPIGWGYQQVMAEPA